MGRYTVTAWHNADVHNGPYIKPDNVISKVAAGEVYTADCWTNGQAVDDEGYHNDIWIRLPLPAGGVGYVSAIYLEGDERANLPEATGYC